MAGFADEISHFNPYISQIPTDEYVNAGMLEQGRYDAGVARTQNFIDNVAGLQVAGDANTQYLRNKVSELEGKVSQVVGSDFAKNSVSNQVGQLTGMIYRDPVVQAGMTSALRLQQYQKSWEDLKKDHPDQYSDKNKEYFDQYVNDYLKQSKGKAGLVYNGPTDATPYVDYYDKLDKQLKSLEPSIQTSISPSGEFMYKVDKSSTVSKQQIDGVINSVMTSDPRIQQQMQIDSWHTYRSFDGQQMFNHINDSYNAMIDNYLDNSKYYRDAIKANPNDYQTITSAQQKLVDFNTEIKMLQANRDTYLKALNEGKIDQVKQSVFNDSVRQGLILKYERNNITTDLHNNENAIEAWKNHWEELNYGVKLKDLDLKSKEYELKLLEWQMKNKGTAEGQTVSIAGAVGEDYTEGANNATITSIQSDIGSYKTKLRSYYPNMSDSEWNKYQETQEAKFQAGDATVDPKYAQFKSLTQSQRILESTYKDIGNSIYADASKKYDVAASLPEWTRFNGVDMGGGTKRDVAVDRNTLAKALSLRDALLSHQKTETHEVAGSAGGVFTTTTQPTAQDIQMEEQRFAGDPNFKYIKTLAEGALNGKDVLQPTASDVTSLTHQKDAYVADQFKNFGLTTSYTAQPIVGKKEVVDQIARLTATAASQQGDKIEADKINPLNYYNNDQGKLVIQYQKQKDDKLYQVEVPAAKNLLGDPDPYLQIARAIDLSPSKSTPIDANKALSSVNGKIKYVLQKDPLSGDYELRIWNKGALYNVPSFTVNGSGFNRPNIGSYVERIEALSKLKNEDIDKWIATLSANQ